jgi:hypothetical protein
MSDAKHCPDPKCAHPLADHECVRCGCVSFVRVSWGVASLCASCGDAQSKHRCSHHPCRLNFCEV